MYVMWQAWYKRVTLCKVKVAYYTVKYFLKSAENFLIMINIIFDKKYNRPIHMQLLKYIFHSDKHSTSYMFETLTGFPRLTLCFNQVLLFLKRFSMRSKLENDYFFLFRLTASVWRTMSNKRIVSKCTRYSPTFGK